MLSKGTNFLISIIMPSYNSGEYIRKSIDSVLNQSYKNFELIIIDDCSSDNTVDIITSYQDKRIKLLKNETNQGAGITRNKGLLLSNGRFICFLDSDDTWRPDKLEKQLTFMLSNNIDFCFSAYDRVSEDNTFICRIGVPEKVNYSDMLKVCSIGCLTVMFDKDKFTDFSMPSIRKRQDYALWLKLLKQTPYAYGINEPLGFYNIRENSISSNKLNAAKYQWKIYREIEDLNLFYASYYFFHYSFNGFFRSKFPSLAKKLGLLR
ncbi:glycosyltransferase family 2 protein [Proteus mirabilis]|uniref:glycosyltransferase family 2 protein n=1 Tax=Proteus mirabilis TaxID=584 RepID=UPI001A2D5ED3|nr:glycosyltransferase family 2 protein [Proteus mirabilis]MBI6251656.1 glycosyltransferase family 2 protein [Proteus mirabilis]MBI6288939.1 glycosyltransferase family 2 protein [Proteus mirabilis]MDL4028557.1 glycosyltransferase family 2 protein [Proteus mirabilis]MDM3687736.1 glycosyltransferase family 2 protein [Proteus mirabilis]MDM9217552.1 glycosyltransferase family 2 protein [Proteus mirabilis]